MKTSTIITSASTVFTAITRISTTIIIAHIFRNEKKYSALKDKMTLQMKYLVKLHKSVCMIATSSELMRQNTIYNMCIYRRMHLSMDGTR